jgi:hypothetical protein
MVGRNKHTQTERWDEDVCEKVCSWMFNRLKLQILLWFLMLPIANAMHKDMNRLPPVASEQREHATQQEPHRFFSLMMMMML